MSQKESPEEFYQRFKVQLEQAYVFPCDFQFKLIVPTAENTEKLAAIDTVFAPSYIIDSRVSGKETYTSHTVKILAENADEIIEKYQKLAQIKGLITI